MNHPLDDPFGIRIRVGMSTRMQATREKLLAAATQGTLTYSHHLGGFSFRVSAEVTARDAAKRQAPDQAEPMAMEPLERAAPVSVMFVTVSAGQRVNDSAG